MRKAFVETLVDLAAGDPRIMLLTGDLGFMALEPFADCFPKRFVNTGVAEQNMVGMATGLAEAGFIPYVYSIVTFATLRPLEFIRNGPILHRLPVRIVGMGGGFEYGTAGATHFGLEDVGVLRTQPGITIIAPADYRQAAAAVRQTWDLPGPIYYRLGKDDRTVVPGLDGRFTLGEVQCIGEGRDLALISMGSVTAEAAAAREMLAREGIDCTLVVLASVHPTPVEPLAALLARFPLAVTVEAHYAVGGIGSLVAEVIAERGLRCRLLRRAVTATPHDGVGSQQYLHQIHGLSAEAIAAAAAQALRAARA